MHSVWQETGSRGLSYFLNTNYPLDGWLHHRPDPPWNLTSTWFYQRGCSGIRLSGLRRELASLAIWRCVFMMGLDTNTWSFSLYLRMMTRIFWVLVLANARLCAFRKNNSPFWAFVAYKIKDLDKVMRFKWSNSLFFPDDCLGLNEGRILKERGEGGGEC